MLRICRQVSAILIFAGIAYFFLDFRNAISSQWSLFERIQLVPALLSASIVTLGILLLISLLFGRIYCSVICPLGIFQDIINRITVFFNKKKRFRWMVENKVLRYSFLVFFIICLIVNIAFLVSLIEPYSIYGRFVTNLFKPVYLFLNNLLAALFNNYGNYYFYRMDVEILSVSSFLVAIFSLIVIVGLSVRNGRIYCNTVCPVGTFLGFLAKFSLFKIRFNPEKCNSCGLCSMKCKASCLDGKNRHVDHSRCVVCFDCLHTCKKDALSYSTAPVIKNKKPLENKSQQDKPRRLFLAMTALTLFSSVRLKAEETISKIILGKSRAKKPAVPPGGQSLAHFQKHCTACHLCVAKCPTQVIKPSLKEYGLSNMMLPMMNYDKNFCNFDCTLCSEVCPTNALKKLTKDEKHALKIGEVVFVLEDCVVYRDNTSCGACSEHCPTQAVRMVPYKNELTIPEITQELCVGCGGCESICPVNPFKAIYIEGIESHEKAKTVEKKEVREVEIDDFGF